MHNPCQLRASLDWWFTNQGQILPNCEVESLKELRTRVCFPIWRIHNVGVSGVLVEATFFFGWGGGGGLGNTYVQGGVTGYFEVSSFPSEAQKRAPREISPGLGPMDNSGVLFGSSDFF